MEVDQDKEKTLDKKDGDAEKDGISQAEAAKKKLEKEKVGYEIENLSRVLPAQLKFISFPAGRYEPVKKVRLCSVL
jgi:26S proteasome regulatory subunit N2